MQVLSALHQFEQHSLSSLQTAPSCLHELPDVDPEPPDVDPELPDVDPELPDVDPELPDVDPELPDVLELELWPQRLRLLGRHTLAPFQWRQVAKLVHASPRPGIATRSPQ